MLFMPQEERYACANLMTHSDNHAPRRLNLVLERWKKGTERCRNILSCIGQLGDDVSVEEYSESTVIVPGHGDPDILIAVPVIREFFCRCSFRNDCCVNIFVWEFRHPVREFAVRSMRMQ